jgi:hypothetical protein
VIGVAVIAMGQDHAIWRAGIELAVDMRLVFRAILHVAILVFRQAMKVDFSSGQSEYCAVFSLLRLAGRIFCIPSGGVGILDTAGTSGKYRQLLRFSIKSGL